MTKTDMLCTAISERFPQQVLKTHIAYGELTIDVHPDHLAAVCVALRDEAPFQFTMLIDVCGVDYLHYGIAEWETQTATSTGFERGVDKSAIRASNHETKPFRFGVTYHLLSIQLNQRVRIRARIENSEQPHIASVVSVWPSANWFEREAFDLFGIIFVGHPDLRRILTDYGFIGHPFRKDFPLIGKVEARYDGKLKRVVYESVSITPRVLEPKVIRPPVLCESGE